MNIETAVMLVACVFLLSTSIKVMFGFGEALVAMPLLTLFLTAAEAAPIVSLGSLVSTSLLLAGDRRHMDVRVVATTLVAACFGIPLGLLIVTWVDERAVRLLLAGVLFAYSGLSLWRPQLLYLQNDRTLPLFAVVAGTLGGAYNTHGPPLVVYGTMRKWEPRRFRANLQAYFLPAGCLVAIAHGAAGLWTRNVLLCVAGGLCVSLPTVLIGRRLHRILPQRDYSRGIHLLLLVLATVLAVRAFETRPPAKATSPTTASSKAVHKAASE